MLLESLTVVSTLLKDLLYISYLVPSERVRKLVPSILRLQTTDDKVFVSVVMMRNTSVGPLWIPWPRQHYNQLNIRTYVDDPTTGGGAVFFFRSGITSLSALAVPRLLGLPWEKITLHLESKLTSGGLCSLKANGDFHGMVVMEAQSSRRGGAPSPDTTEQITAPQIGFVTATDQHRLLRFRVKHPFVEPVLCDMTAFRFPLLEQTGMVKKEEMGRPHSVLLVPSTQFLIYLPPRRVRETYEVKG
jgi:uncharacterized protein YqjF (DUF2071 family)